jgi:hypothetical protein
VVWRTNGNPQSCISSFSWVVSYFIYCMLTLLLCQFDLWLANYLILVVGSYELICSGLIILA